MFWYDPHVVLSSRCSVQLSAFSDQWNWSEQCVRTDTSFAHFATSCVITFGAANIPARGLWNVELCDHENRVVGGYCTGFGGGGGITHLA